jgi:hypothetical protein
MGENESCLFTEEQEREIRRMVREEMEAWHLQPRPIIPPPDDLVRSLRRGLQDCEAFRNLRRDLRGGVDHTGEKEVSQVSAVLAHSDDGDVGTE